MKAQIYSVIAAAFGDRKVSGTHVLVYSNLSPRGCVHTNSAHLLIESMYPLRYVVQLRELASECRR